MNTNIAYSLKHIFRFQDDLIVFEDDGVFTTVSGNIYQAEMVLKNTNLSPNEVNCLDLNNTLCAISGKYVYKSYDKGMILILKLLIILICLEMYLRNHAMLWSFYFTADKICQY